MQNKPLVDKADIGFVSNSLLSNKLAELVFRALKIDEINNIYQTSKHKKGAEFTTEALKSLNISYTISDPDIENIPKTGGAIVICNHPTGALDGIMLIDAICKVRPDTKFLSNFMLMHLETLKDQFLPVDPFSSRNKRNISGIMKAVSFVEEGGLLVIFPAGEVSTYYNGKKEIEDKRWSKSVLKFIYNLKVPVVPVYIEAKNSKTFHRIGKIHPILRTLRLPAELVNKQNNKFRIRIGSPLSVKIQRDLGSSDNMGDVLRVNTYLLKHGFEKNSIVTKFISEAEPIADPISDYIIAADIENARKSCFLFANGALELFLIPPGEYPNIIKNIGVLRETTFRSVGEGSGKAMDIDIYDEHYHQLIIWDSSSSKIIGGYRIGMGKEIMKSKGIDGFYTSTFFQFGNKIKDILPKTMELGRSFVVEEYQRRPMPLLLLWKGIMYTLLKNCDYRYLFGPASISGEYNDISKQMIRCFLEKNYFDSEFSHDIKSKIGIKSIKEYNVDFINDLNISIVEKFLKDIEKGNTIPVLIKKYISIGGKILAFNVDPEFNNSLDCFVLLDINDVPINTLEMLAKDMDLDQITKRFEY